MELKSESPLKAILNSPLRSAPTECPSTSNMPPPLTPRVPGRNVLPQSSINVVSPMSAVSGDPASTICLQNVVATINLGCELNLTDIYFRTRNSEYNPSRFSGVVMRIREPRVTALVFRSGKIVCTGGRSEKDALLAGKKFARIIQKLGFPVVMKEFTVQNMVATCDLRFPIKLEHLHQLHGQFSSYEPELFQGLIYRMVKPRLVVLVFVNGKLVFTGCKSRQDIKEAFDNILPILKSFRKN